LQASGLPNGAQKGREMVGPVEVMRDPYDTGVRKE